MPFVVKVGAKTIGVVKKRSDVNRILARQFRKNERVSVLPFRTMKKPKRKR